MRILAGIDVLGAIPQRAPATPTRPETEVRAEIVKTLTSLIGTPYIWAGKSPQTGLDCSGAVLWAYEKAKIATPGARQRFNADDLYRHSRRVEREHLRPGDLVFYGRGLPFGRVTHVMVYAGDNRVIGATGGGPKTLTVADASRAKASVRFEPIDYRRDIAGYGAAPIGTPMRETRGGLLLALGVVGLGSLGLVLARRA